MYKKYPHLKKLMQKSPQEYPRETPSLKPLRKFLHKIDNPQKNFASILIGGTNGKGSVVHYLEKILLNSNLNVAAYSSPHIECVNERFKIRGQNIELNLLEEILSAWNPSDLAQLSFFEIGTALAFEAFSRQKVSLAILEVGLGGRLDATNVVDPLISVVVSLGLDHQDILGHSLTEIAYEKIGIFRETGVNLLGPLRGDKRIFMNEILMIETLNVRRTDSFDLGVLENKIKLDHQRDNAKTILAIISELRKLGHDVPDKNIEQAFSLPVPWRLEMREGILWDVAHNEESFTAQMQYLAKQHPDKKIVYLLSLSRNKNVAALIEKMGEQDHQLLICETSHSRTMMIAEWKKRFS